MKHPVLILLFVVTFLLSACASLRPMPPEVQLSGLEISDVSLTHANMLATLRLFNPNSTRLDVNAVRFTLYLNKVRIASGQTAKSIQLPAEGTGDAAVRLSSSFLELLQLSGTMQGRENVDFRIVGEIRLGGTGLFGTSIPIEREGTIPLTAPLRQLFLTPGN